VVKTPAGVAERVDAPFPCLGLAEVRLVGRLSCRVESV
jgi:hypothetical protein